MKKRYFGVTLLVLGFVGIFSIFIAGCEGQSKTQWKIPIEEFSDDYYNKVYDRVIEMEEQAKKNRKESKAYTADLWPENGKVIATIDGKEYRYDPIYLYRLTCAAWDNDYQLKSWDNANIKQNIVYLNEKELPGDLVNMSLKDNAVFLELLYLDSLENTSAVSDESNPSEEIQYYDDDFYKEILRCFEQYHDNQEDSLPIESLTKVVVAHENAKFYQWQSDEDFWRQVEPFQKKLADIAKLQAPFQYKPEELEYKTIGSHLETYYNDLKEKYNVKMLK